MKFEDRLDDALRRQAERERDAREGASESLPSHAAATAPSETPDTSVRGIADELSKLVQLRDQGVLSHEELETLKNRLISTAVEAPRAPITAHSVASRESTGSPLGRIPRVLTFVAVVAIALIVLTFCGPRSPGAEAESSCLQKRNGVYELEGQARLACLESARRSNVEAQDRRAIEALRRMAEENERNK
jgi:hypothetical protein